jgi:hypothetical protein
MPDMTDTGAHAQSAPRASADPGGRCSLYRFYDGTEKLLYVGISNEPWRRRREHAYSQPWWPQVRHQAVTWYDAEWQAREAETRAIKGELPRFNKAGAVRAEPVTMGFALKLRPMRWAFWGALLSTAIWVPVVIMACTRPTPLMQDVLVPITLTACVTGPAALFVAVILTASPLIARFAAWLDRICIWPEGVK